jgi:dipeptide transport system ATP-binding protein
MEEDNMETNTPLLQVEDLKIHFPLRRSLWKMVVNEPKKSVKAVDGVSFSIDKGKTLAIVGESGCGKTTLGRSLVGLNTLVGGKILYKGEDISANNAWATNRLRKEIQYIFQNPYASLNPKMTILNTVQRPLEIFSMYDGKHRTERALDILGRTGISPALAFRYPHEFSGGQRQRICIARALAVEPELIIADEPTSALDVSIQCQILDLLMELQRELTLTMLFISHDLGVVDYISDEVIIMYLGHIVEKGNTHAIFKHPAHPYTQALLEALPRRGSSRHQAKLKLEGYISSAIDPPKGCLLHPRCPYAKNICATVPPSMKEVDKDRYVACHFPLGMTVDNRDSDRISFIAKE